MKPTQGGNMTIQKTKKLFPKLPIYTNWNKVGKLKTKTALKREGKWSDDLQPVGVFVSMGSKNAHYFLYLL